MELEFRHGDNIHKVNIEAEDNPQKLPGIYKATVGESSYKFSVSRVAANWLMLFHERQNRRIYIAQHDNRLFVHVDGRIVTLDKVVCDQKTFSRDMLEFGSRDQITTPMPGKVVKILVREGERVQFKQPLAIVESMKMENEIKSPADGVVKSIHFNPGDLVETGQPIIRIQPDRPAA